MLRPEDDGLGLEDRIRAARKVTLDGSKAIYDLRFGVDFSKPKETAQAIAQVVWDEDVESMWSMKDDTPVFTPTRNVEILVPNEHNRKIAKAVEGFREDLRDEELGQHLGGYLDSVEDNEADWGAIFLLGPLWAWLMQSADNRARRRDELRSLFDKMAASIKISSSP